MEPYEIWMTALLAVLEVTAAVILAVGLVRALREAKNDG